jgi:LacI family transcriptional regulator
MSQNPSVLKYRQISNSLRDQITSGQLAPGEKLPGEQDLAKRFEVSYMTMRQAVTTLVEEGALLRIKGKGTFVAEVRSGSTSHGQPMGLLFPGELQHLDPYYFPEVLRGYTQVMDEHGLPTSLYTYDANGSSPAFEPGMSIACLLFGLASLQVIEWLRDFGYPVVAINRYRGRRKIPSVWIDDANGVGKAVDHLVSLGHERIGFLPGPLDNLDAAERLRGFRLASKRFQLRSAPEAGAGFTESSGYDGARALLSANNRPTALVCASDLSAMGAIKAARDLGLSVPRDLSIVGFGDFSVADYVLPSLTTVKQSRVELGRAAASAVIRLSRGEPVIDQKIEADLVLRESALVYTTATPIEVSVGSH